MAECTTMERRKPGRPKRGVTVKSQTIMISEEQKEWCMQQPEGMSAYVRRLIREDQMRQRRNEGRDG